MFDDPVHTPVDSESTEPGDAPEPFGDPNDPDDPDDPNDPFGGGNVPNVPMANPPPPAINYDPGVFKQDSLLKAFEKVPELKDAKSYGLFKQMTRLVLDTGNLDMHL